MSTPLRFAALFLAALAVYFAGGYWADIPSWARSVIKTGVVIALLVSTYLCSRHERLRPWRPVSLALLAASAGFLVSWWTAPLVLDGAGITPDTAPGLAMTKLVDAVLVVLPVLLVARAGGVGWPDLYLGRGRPRWWLAIGATAFGACVVLLLLQASRAGVSRGQLVALAPWMLLFVTANGFLEELHFRGLLLRPFETHLGRHGANLCIASVFTLVHAPVNYTADIVPFLGVVFLLALAWGWVIQHTQALWGAVLFHAGADLLVVFGIFETYGAT